MQAAAKIAPRTRYGGAQEEISDLRLSRLTPPVRLKVRIEPRPLPGSSESGDGLSRLYNSLTEFHHRGNSRGTTIRVTSNTLGLYTMHYTQLDDAVCAQHHC